MSWEERSKQSLLTSAPTKNKDFGGGSVAALFENLHVRGAAGDKFDRDALLKVGVLHGASELLRAGDCLLIDGGDDVPGFDSFARGRSVLLHGDDHYALSQGYTKLFGQLAG